MWLVLGVLSGHVPKPRPTELKAYRKEESMRELERRGEEREGRERKKGGAWKWGELEN